MYYFRFGRYRSEMRLKVRGNRLALAFSATLVKRYQSFFGFGLAWAGKGLGFSS